MGEQVAARLQMGLELSWLERTPDKREVGGSSPLKPSRQILTDLSNGEYEVFS